MAECLALWTEISNMLFRLLLRPNLRNSLPHVPSVRGPYPLLKDSIGNQQARVPPVLPGFHEVKSAGLFGNPSLQNHPYLAPEKAKGGPAQGCKEAAVLDSYNQSLNSPPPKATGTGSFASL